MNLEDFDEEEIVIVPQEIVAVSDTERRQIEAVQTERIRRYRSARNLVVTPEVAEALREGWTTEEIAQVLQLSVQTVNKYVKSAEMQPLIDREMRRVLNHLAGRKLDHERYRDLVISLGVLIEKSQLLRNEPTEIHRHEGGTVDRLAILLFGSPGGRRESAEAIDVTPSSRSCCLPSVHEALESGGEEESRNNSDGGDESAIIEESGSVCQPLQDERRT